jgi:hypothetical protein
MIICAQEGRRGRGGGPNLSWRQDGGRKVYVGPRYSTMSQRVRKQIKIVLRHHNWVGSQGPLFLARDHSEG